MIDLIQMWRSYLICSIASTCHSLHIIYAWRLQSWWRLGIMYHFISLSRSSPRAHVTLIVLKIYVTHVYTFIQTNRICFSKFQGHRLWTRGQRFYHTKSRQCANDNLDKYARVSSSYHEFSFYDGTSIYVRRACDYDAPPCLHATGISGHKSTV